MLSSLSCVLLFMTPWTIAHQAPPSMGFSRQEYWSGLPLPSPKRFSSVQSLSHVLLFMTPWTIAYQASLSMGFSRQEYWSGLPLLSPGGLPDTGIKPTSLMSPVLSGRFFTTRTTWEAPIYIKCC